MNAVGPDVNKPPLGLSCLRQATKKIVFKIQFQGDRCQRENQLHDKQKDKKKKSKKKNGFR